MLCGGALPPATHVGCCFSNKARRNSNRRKLNFNAEHARDAEDRKEIPIRNPLLETLRCIAPACPTADGSSVSGRLVVDGGTKFPSTASSPLKQPVLKLGGASDPPAPVGDPPTGIAASNFAKRRSALARTVAPVPSGESPDGTGGSPVLPANHFSNTL